MHPQKLKVRLHEIVSKYKKSKNKKPTISESLDFPKWFQMHVESNIRQKSNKNQSQAPKQMSSLLRLHSGC